MDKKAIEQLKEAKETIVGKEKEKKKVLILSLGTGSILGNNVEKMTLEEKKDKLARREYSYRSAVYYFDDKKDTVNTEFVAEPLMKRFCPDEVFIIGTSKSSWTGFYGKFGDDNDQKDEVILRLFELEENGGKDLDSSAIKKYTQTIESYFERGMKKGIFAGVKVHVIVMRYGINGKELLENYCLIRDAIGSVLRVKKEKYRYEVAFDITHSFRSMPIYNLVVINYLQNVSQIDLEITHIYYGNFELSHDNDGLSPIVDLDELIRVLELSNNVSEFKNTGNAVSLIGHIPDRENELKKALEAFDWATQINDYDAVMDGLQKLIELSVRSDTMRSGKYVDLQEMVFNVIRYKFFANEEVQYDTDNSERLLKELQSMTHAEKQYRLSEWYYNQNRYGQALATGLEALRSYLVPMYLEWKGKDINRQNENDENYRKAAVDRLRNLVAMIRENKVILTEEQDIVKVICSLEDCRKTVQLIRNTFAHNLGGNGDESNNIATTDRNPKESIRMFFEVFRQFVELMQTDRDSVAAIYQAEANTKKTKAGKEERAARLIIASENAKVDYEAYRKSANGTEYSVYRLDQEIVRYLDNHLDNSKALRNSSIFLAEYVKKQKMDINITSVILYRLTLNQQINYMQILNAIGIQHFCDENRRVEKLPKLTFELQEENYKKILEKWNCENNDSDKIQTFMDKELICVYE